MDQLDQPVSELEGNTNSSRSKLGYRFCFTLNNYTESETKGLLDHFNTKHIKYIIGYEKGEQGTPHLQGYIESPKRIRPIECFKNKRIHWESAKGSKDDNFKYCSKDGLYDTNILDVFLPDISPEGMYPWQKEILDICLSVPDKRSIHWYWDSEGNSGKTTLAKYLSFYHNAIPLRGKTNDILHCAAEHNSSIYIFISPRTNEDYFPYEGLELIKDGYFMSGKFESKPIIRPSPHVIVFANFEPNTSKLSLDRWIIHQI